MYSVEKYYKMLSLIKIYVKSTIIVTSLVNGDLTEKCWFFRKKKKRKQCDRVFDDFSGKFKCMHKFVKPPLQCKTKEK